MCTYLFPTRPASRTPHVVASCAVCRDRGGTTLTRPFRLARFAARGGPQKTHEAGSSLCLVLVRTAKVRRGCAARPPQCRHLPPRLVLVVLAELRQRRRGCRDERPGAGRSVSFAGRKTSDCVQKKGAPTAISTCRPNANVNPARAFPPRTGTFQSFPLVRPLPSRRRPPTLRGRGAASVQGRVVCSEPRRGITPNYYVRAGPARAGTEPGRFLSPPPANRSAAICTPHGRGGWRRCVAVGGGSRRTRF